jgi:hypothetical protein
MVSRFRILLILIAGSTLVGCVASKQMSAIPDSQALTAPLPSKAVVVFVGPSSFGGAVQSSVFDLSVEPMTLVGIVSAGKKVAYATDPGARRFMVIGESAEFMDANLLAGKTYYARDAPHGLLEGQVFARSGGASGDREAIGRGPRKHQLGG